MTDNARVTALRLLLWRVIAHQRDRDRRMEDRAALLAEIVEDAINEVPENFHKVEQATSMQQKVLEEARQHPYDLIIMGASGRVGIGHAAGTIDDGVAEHAPFGAAGRRFEPTPIARLLPGESHRARICGTATWTALRFT